MIRTTTEITNFDHFSDIDMSEPYGPLAIAMYKRRAQKHYEAAWMPLFEEDGAKTGAYEFYRFNEFVGRVTMTEAGFVPQPAGEEPGEPLEWAVEAIVAIEGRQAR